MTTFIVMEPLASDPELEPGGFITLERADGRSVWRQRFVVAQTLGPYIYLKPVEPT